MAESYHPSLFVFPTPHDPHRHRCKNKTPSPSRTIRVLHMEEHASAVALTHAPIFPRDRVDAFCRPPQRVGTTRYHTLCISLSRCLKGNNSAGKWDMEARVDSVIVKGSPKIWTSFIAPSGILLKFSLSKRSHIVQRKGAGPLPL